MEIYGFGLFSKKILIRLLTLDFLFIIFIELFKGISIEELSYEMVILLRLALFELKLFFKLRLNNPSLMVNLFSFFFFFLDYISLIS